MNAVHRTDPTDPAGPTDPDDALAAWIATERSVAERLEAGPGPGVPSREQIEGRTGLEVMTAMLEGRIPYAAIARTLDFTLISVEPGVALFQGSPMARYLNPLGTIHGGWVATLLDSALGCAVHTLMPPGRGYTTAELSVNYVKGLTPKVARVRAQGNVIHCGRQLATAQARLFGADGTLYAHATTTCLVFEMPPRR